MTELLQLADLCRLFQLKEGAARNLTKLPGFPPRIATSSRCHRWDAEEVAAYVRRLREQPASTPARPTRSNATSRSRSEGKRISGALRPVRSSRRSA